MARLDASGGPFLEAWTVLVTSPVIWGSFLKVSLALVLVAAGVWIGVMAAGIIFSRVETGSDRNMAADLEAREHLRRGIELARQGLHDGAVAEFRKSISLSPENPDTHYHMGRSLLNLAIRGRAPLQEAVTALEEALRIDPFRDYVRIQLAEVYCLRRPNHFDPNKATALFEELLDRHPSRYEVRLRYAACLMNSEIRVSRRADPSRVLQDSAWTLDLVRFHVEKAIDQAPVDSEDALTARSLLADVLFRGGEFEQARGIFRYLIGEFGERGLDMELAWSTIGHAYYREEKYLEAVEPLRKAVDVSPTLARKWDLKLAYDKLGGYPADLPAFYRFPQREEKPPPSGPPDLAFSDIAGSLRINRYAGAGPTGWADYNGDGRFDLLACGCDTFCNLYRAEGKGFVDATIEAKLTRLEPGFASVWADYDNDGDYDFYIARNGWNGPAPNSLLRNNGDGTFTDVAGAAGVDDGGSSFNATWLDYDRDGWLDLLISNGVYLDGSTNQLFRNEGDGSFSNVTARAGLSEDPFAGTIGIAVGDYDDDGWLDIFYHGRLKPNRLYRNNRDGTFVDVTGQARVGGPGRENGYIAFFADFDSDGDLDIFTGCLAKWEEVLAGYAPGYREGPQDDIPRLYRNNGDGTFDDVSIEMGFHYPLGIMAGGVADVDNDGYLDIYLGTGSPDMRRLEPNIFYHNRGGLGFEDMTRHAGLGGLGKGHGITFLDWDGDGDLEIYAEYGGFFHGDFWENAFYLNEKGNRNNWLSIRLEQLDLNRDAVGGRVTVRAGKLSQTQHVLAGSGFGSTDPPILHFGLGKLKKVDRVEIVWPDGTRQSLDSLPVNRASIIRKPELPAR